MFFSKSWKVEIYRTLDGREPFIDWKDQLDLRFKMKVLARLNNLQNGSLGKHRFLGDGISELKFRDGIRVYYSEVKRVIILLLCGGEKNTKRDQSKDIEKAKGYLQDYKRRMK